MRRYMESECNGSAVLVVDDDQSIRQFVGDALRYDGYRVVTAADGAQGLAALPGLGPCVVLLDMRMPYVDGWEFSRRYRAGADTGAAIVVMTASEHAEQWCEEIGGDACLEKPFDLDALYAVVARFCASAASTG